MLFVKVLLTLAFIRASILAVFSARNQTSIEYNTGFLLQGYLSNEIVFFQRIPQIKIFTTNKTEFKSS